MTIDGLRVLVTGGCGFIGSHITQSLSNKGAQVIAFDNFSSGYRENLEGLSGDVRIIQGDIMDYRKLSRACKGLDVISHQAAQLEITKALADPITDLKVNTEGTLNVFRAAVENGIRKIIYASSAGVYGEARTLPQTEEHPTDPNWPYGVSKLAGEKYADIYSKYYGIEISCLRYGIVYGPREWYGRVLTLFLRRALEGKPPVLWGGDQIRDFIFVTDVVDFHNRLLEESDRAVGVFNVGSGQGTTIRNLAELVVETYHLEEPKYEDTGEGEMSKEVKGRKRLPLELKRMVLDNSKAKKLGWRPEVSLIEGIKKEYAWLQNNVHRWKELRY
ncbi:NAD-dependent epimerase/dehydratase family protein [Candidatus Bathyarchaeota archaeon]|nr:MAG: NAD-dependent epimerase/dehydratase family protein [Candidatus Bathyarchaeota archaeon]